jgi:hypothetical protein
MKKILPFLLILVLTGISHVMYAQAKHYVIFEHFTQASCGPCAAQNPVLQAVLDANTGRTHHIAYHTSWPGYDPMNTYNPTQVADRVAYYGVNAVPDVLMCGNLYHGGPSGVTQSMVDNTASDPAPIRVIVKETSNGTTRTVNVKVFTVDTVPAGNYKIRVAVAEKWIHYPTPPGSNGEKDFPDVFRKMIPSSGGDTYTPAAIGDSVSFTYTYALDLTHWDTTQIYATAMIQNETTKGMLNSGSSIDPHWELVGLDHPFAKASGGVEQTFRYNLINLGDAPENFRVKVSGDQPSDWSLGFEIGGTTYFDSLDITIPAKTTLLMNVHVTSGDVAALANFLVSLQSLDNPQFAAQVLRFNLIKGIYEMIINNDGSWGDGSATTTTDYQQNYISGLTYAGSTTFAVTTLTTYLKGYKYSCMDDVLIYFFNVGWSFPAFTDESVATFTAELNAGKRLFVSGQDVGWDVWTDPASGGHGDAAQQAFYTNFLCANWLNDGATSDNQLIANTADPVFGGIATSALVNTYGGTYFFPDEINAVGIGQKIFYYNTAMTKISGVRADNGTWKTVYLAPSLEQVGDSNVRKEIIKISHVWFGGETLGTGAHTGMVPGHLGQNYPNPAGNATTILLDGIDRAMTLEVTDMTGRIVNTSGLTTGMSQVTVNTAGLTSGMYLYRLVSEGRILETKRMQIVH